jgi:hypothetical protein
MEAARSLAVSTLASLDQGYQKDTTMTNFVPRFAKRAIGTGVQPTAIYSFTVTGRGAFPFDMLRHDMAWPASGDADFTGTERRSIALRSYHEPTINRWKTFMWSVGV